MKYITGFFRFWYDFIVGDCWEIAAGVAVLMAASAMAIRSGVVDLQATTSESGGEIVVHGLNHPVFPLALGGAIMLLLVISVYIEFRRKLAESQS